MRRVLSLVCVTVLANFIGCAAGTPSVEPPPDSPQLTRSLELRCPNDAERCGELALDILSHLELRRQVSKPSENLWFPFAESEPLIRTDAERLWNSGMLESLWVEVRDEPYPNGVAGKRIVFNMVTREGEPVVPSEAPSVPAGFEEPPPGHQRVYP
jgi:hypothetical protein